MLLSRRIIRLNCLKVHYSYARLINNDCTSQRASRRFCFALLIPYIILVLWWRNTPISKNSFGKYMWIDVQTAICVQYWIKHPIMQQQINESIENILLNIFWVIHIIIWKKKYYWMDTWIAIFNTNDIAHGYFPVFFTLGLHSLTDPRCSANLYSVQHSISIKLTPLLFIYKIQIYFEIPIRQTRPSVNFHTLHSSTNVLNNSPIIHKWSLAVFLLRT